jgi:hypothetical protein
VNLLPRGWNTTVGDGKRDELHSDRGTAFGFHQEVEFFHLVSGQQGEEGTDPGGPQRPYLVLQPIAASRSGQYRQPAGRDAGYPVDVGSHHVLLPGAETAAGLSVEIGMGSRDRDVF